MPMQELMSRLKSIRKPRDQKKEPREDGSPKERLQPSQRTKVAPPYNSNQPNTSQPKPLKGLRKASVSARLPIGRGISNRSIDQNRDQEQDQNQEQDLDPEPSDYLYFGEGISAKDISQSLMNRTQGKSTSNQPGQLSIGPINHSTPSNTGKDNSGFIDTGLNTHTAQMGYSSLTYGGSLQYDYSGTHGQPFVG
ncbi:hypothetical protein F5B19DRAFT_377621 [Rostrohypoxylon terebratum]|nr:hypothetical protein F5B19DRAFT_377621 [Rostrohypoxylon terebratum]